MVDEDAPSSGLSECGPSTTTTVAARHSRRLADKVLTAFHHACDLGEFEIADRLLQILETMTTRRRTMEDTNRRKTIHSLVAAHERLWHLKHPSTE